MNSETLISKQGPLGYVWLAANYDKKLSKHQLLSTDISQSTRLITSRDSTVGSNFSSIQGDNASHQGITLRVSGQLLLGIVRIYSRKTKYLLDDVNEILLKLKTSFKLSGVNVVSSNTINLQAKDTIVKNLQQITLHDQITKFDLLYQPDLQLDDIHQSQSMFNLPDTEDLSTSFDHSIEVGRNITDNVDLDHTEADIDLQLDFDNTNDFNEADLSVEMGRNADAASFQDMSLLDIDNNDHANKADDFESNFDDFDLGLPLETIDELPQTEPQQPVPVVPRVRRTGISEDGELITNKRKLKIDDVLDIPIQKLKDYQEEILSKTDNYQLYKADKLNIIYSEVSALKRRRLEVPFQVPTPEPEDIDDVADRAVDFNDDFDVDFDISLPELQPQTPNEPSDAEDDIVSSTQDNVHSTKQIAEELQSIYLDTTTTMLSNLIECDLHINEKDSDKQPLGLTSDNKINNKRQASKCFFELLVLATNDCVELKQDVEPTKIGGDICITGRDRLYSFF